MGLSYGLSVYDVGAADLVALARAAEVAGFESLWLGEHILMPADYEAVHPTREAAEERAARIVGPDTHLLDPLVALAAVAAQTRHLTIGTAVYLLPLRHPLVTARAAMTLQELAGGRLRLGVGAGWLAEEFEALGVPFDDRTARTTEGVAILRKAFAGGIFEHHGGLYDFGPVQVSPVPVQIPIVAGGNTPAALRRAARWADGWFASGNPTGAEAGILLGQLMEVARAVGRQGPLTTHVRVSPPSTEHADTYAAAGADQMVFWAHEMCPAGPDTPPGPDRWAGLPAAAARLGVRPAADLVSTRPAVGGEGPA